MAAAVSATGALGSIGVGGNRPGCFVRFREVDCGTRVTDMVKVSGRRPSQVSGPGHEPAYGNRPCTNPRATRNAPMGF